MGDAGARGLGRPVILCTVCCSSAQQAEIPPLRPTATETAEPPQVTCIWIQLSTLHIPRVHPDSHRSASFLSAWEKGSSWLSLGLRKDELKKQKNAILPHLRKMGKERHVLFFTVLMLQALINTLKKRWNIMGEETAFRQQ